jgi:alcohol dehydrogenase
MIAENRSLMAFNLVWLWERVDRLSAMYDRMAAGWATPPFIGRHFAFTEAPAALRFLQSGASVGKLVLEVEPD